MVARADVGRLLCSLFVVILAGCSGTPADDAGGQRASSPAAVTARTPLAPLYFSVTNVVRVSSETFAAFDVLPGAEVELEVVTKDGSALRFEILWLPSDGPSELVNAFHADSGFALTSLVAARATRVVLHFPAALPARDVVVHLDCKSDGARCGPPQREGLACMVDRDCEAGLFCYPAPGACKADLMGGTCARPVDAAACASAVHAPVPACDGRVYDSACLALAAGVGLLGGAAGDAGAARR